MRPIFVRKSLFFEESQGHAFQKAAFQAGLLRVKVLPAFPLGLSFFDKGERSFKNVFTRE